MQTKSFIAILLCAVILVTGIYTAYQLGDSNGYKKGFTDGGQKIQGAIETSNAHALENNYVAGYNAGLKAAQNQTSP